MNLAKQLPNLDVPTEPGKLVIFLAKATFKRTYTLKEVCSNMSSS